MVVLSAALLTCLSAWFLSFTQLERNRLVKTLMPFFQRSWQVS
jgi:hypothetical protein